MPFILLELVEGKGTRMPSFRAFLLRQGWLKVFQVAKLLDNGDPGVCPDSTALWRLGKAPV